MSRKYATHFDLRFIATIMTAAPLAVSAATNTYGIAANQAVALAAGETAIVSQNNPATTITGASITVGEGATLILNGVNFTTSASSAITCTGNATIILADGTANTVASTSADSAGIKVGPGDTTLAIAGSGSLHASGGAYGAGIGGGRIDKNTGETVGNICILSGTVSGVCSTSGGQPSAAGIGSGFKGTCGDILIAGGVVTGLCTTASNSYGAGIGSGIEGNCGGITIAPGAREVVAIRGAKSTNNAIGAGYNAECGPISFDGSLALATAKSYLAHDTWIITHYSYSGAGSSASPYSVSTAEELESILASGYPAAMHVTLVAGVALVGDFIIPASLSSLTINLNGGSVAALSTNSPAITLAGPTLLSIVGSGNVDGNGTAEAVSAPDLVSYGENVVVRAAPTASAVFPNEGDAIITKFEQTSSGNWHVFAFSELEEGTAEGVQEDMISIYSSDTIDGLSDPSAKLRLTPTSVKNAVKAEFDVGSEAQTQFFRVKFQNAD